MKLKRYLEKKLEIEFAINKNFIASIRKVRHEDKSYYYYVDYYSVDIDPFCDEFDYQISGITFTGEETITQAKKMIKDYFKQTKNVSDTKLIKSCWNEFNNNEDYTMTMKQTKAFVKDMKKTYKIGNDFMMNEMGIYGLISCASSLGY